MATCSSLLAVGLDTALFKSILTLSRADWVNKTIKKKRIRQGSVISLYNEIHEDDNDLIPFILETKYDTRT